MRNRSLGEDYIRRAANRLYALDALFEKKSWADVVREAQEIVELSLKGLLRLAQIEVPRVHDVSPALLAHRDRIPKAIEPYADRLADISRELRRDRELAFYGSEDLTPSHFYRMADARKARDDARWVVDVVRNATPKPPRRKAR